MRNVALWFAGLSNQPYCCGYHFLVLLFAPWCVRVSLYYAAGLLKDEMNGLI